MALLLHQSAIGNTERYIHDEAYRNEVSEMNTSLLINNNKIITRQIQTNKNQRY